MQRCVISKNYTLNWSVGVLRTFLSDEDGLLRLAEYSVAQADVELQKAGRLLEVSGAGVVGLFQRVELLAAAGRVITIIPCA